MEANARTKKKNGDSIMSRLHPSLFAFESPVQVLFKFFRPQEACKYSFLATFVGALMLALFTLNRASSSPNQVRNNLSIESKSAYLRFSVEDSVGFDPDLVVTPSEARLTFRGLSPGWFGGEGVVSCKDLRCDSFEVKPGVKDEDTVLLIRFRYPSGDKAPVSPRMETFLSRSPDGRRLNFDFWMKSGATKAMKRVSDEKNRVEKLDFELRQRAKQEVEQTQRAQALAETAKDLAKFCKEPANLALEPTLPFLPIANPIPIEKLEKRYPDQDFAYFLPQDSSESSKMRRFAQEMYEEGKFGLAEKTLKFFEKEERERANQLKADVDYLRANIAFRMGRKELALELLRDVRKNYPLEPSALSASQYLVIELYKQGKTQEAADIAVEMLQKFPKHADVLKYLWVAAESYYLRNLSDRSIELYKTLRDDPKSPIDLKSFAQMRIGDNLLYRKQYDQALAEYTRLFVDYPNESATWVNPRIHRAEALFQLGQYKVAFEKFHEVYEKFSENSETWRTLLRMAEIKAQDPSSKERIKSREYYTELLNRFPYSPGVVLAKMALMPCEDHAGFDLKMATDFFDRDAKEFSAKQIFWMDAFSKMRGTARVRTLVIMGGLEAALEASFQERAYLPRNSEIAQWLRGVERQLFRNLILDALDRKDVFAGLLIYDKYMSRVDFESRVLTKGHEVFIDPSYLKRLSESAAEAGLESYAQKILSSYKAQSTLYQSSVYESLKMPSNLSDAEAGKSELTYGDLLDLVKSANPEESLKKISEAKTATSLTGQIEKLLAQAEISIKAGKKEQSVTFLESARMILEANSEKSDLNQVYELKLIEQKKYLLLQAKLKPEVEFQILMTLGEQPNFSEVKMSHLRRGIYQKFNYPALFTPDECFERAGSVISTTNPAKALDAYSAWVKRAPKDPKALYFLAQTYDRMGRHSDALKNFQKLAETQEKSFWKELAQRKIAGEQAAREGQKL